MTLAVLPYSDQMIAWCVETVRSHDISAAKQSLSVLRHYFCTNWLIAITRRWLAVRLGRRGRERLDTGEKLMH